MLIITNCTIETDRLITPPVVENGKTVKEGVYDVFARLLAQNNTTHEIVYEVADTYSSEHKYTEIDDIPKLFEQRLYRNMPTYMDYATIQEVDTCKQVLTDDAFGKANSVNELSLAILKLEIDAIALSLLGGVI